MTSAASIRLPFTASLSGCLHCMAPTSTDLAFVDGALDDTGPADHARMLIDAHVHLHDAFPWSVFFNHAARNFRDARLALDLPESTPGCLMLTESARDHAFEKLCASVGRRIERWRVEATDESTSLALQRDDGAQLTVVAGRQIATRERVEVLALGVNDRIADHQPVGDVLDQLDALQAVVVLPWGFGKWLGGRGRVVREIIRSARREPVFLGDNGGRWHAGPKPRLFQLARQHGVHILPGSDPLPFVDQVRKPGSFGFVLRGRLDRMRPAASILWSLRRMQDAPTVFGDGESLLGFVRAQLGMQLRKRLRENAP